MNTDFAGKRVLITGGTKRMGAATLALMHEHGAAIATTARSPAPHLPAGVHLIQADTGPREGIATVIEQAQRLLGGVDILINNVGGSGAPGGGALALDDDAWQQALNDNLLAAVRLDRALLPAMVAQHYGVIIHISSIQRMLPLYDSTLPPGQRSALTARACRRNSARAAYQHRLARLHRDHGRAGVHAPPGRTRPGQRGRVAPARDDVIGRLTRPRAAPVFA